MNEKRRRILTLLEALAEVPDGWNVKVGGEGTGCTGFFFAGSKERLLADLEERRMRRSAKTVMVNGKWENRRNTPLWEAEVVDFFKADRRVDPRCFVIMVPQEYAIKGRNGFWVCSDVKDSPWIKEQKNWEKMWRRARRNSMSVEAYAADGSLIGTYGSQKEAAKALGVGESVVGRAIRNNRPTKDGITFKRMKRRKK